MTKSEKEAIIKKAIDLGFDKSNDVIMMQRLPLGQNNSLLIDVSSMQIVLGHFVKSNINIAHDINDIIPIRKIESPEDLESLFNVICPEKYRLPFG